MVQRRVLLVDDEPSLAVIVSALGRRGGYTVDCCSDVVEAWKLLDEVRPDLVLLDVQLPGPSGVALCRRARATPRLASLPIALFTHWGLSAAIAAGLEAGVDYLVAKDLVGQPARWSARLQEILPAPDGRPPPRLVGWVGLGMNTASLPPNGQWIAPLEKALRHAALRDAGPDVLKIVLRRGLEQASPLASEAAIAADGLSLLPEGLPHALSSDAIARLVGSLADQVWRLLGAEAASPFWAALAEVVPGAPEFAIR